MSSGLSDAFMSALATTKNLLNRCVVLNFFNAAACTMILSHDHTGRAGVIRLLVAYVTKVGTNSKHWSRHQSFLQLRPEGAGKRCLEEGAGKRCLEEGAGKRCLEEGAGKRCRSECEVGRVGLLGLKHSGDSAIVA